MFRPISSLGQQYTLRESTSIVLNHKDDAYEWIKLDNGESTVYMHIKYLVLAKYCFEIKGMDYAIFMKDHMTDAAIFEEIVDWHTLNDEHR